MLLRDKAIVTDAFVSIDGENIAITDKQYIIEPFRTILTSTFNIIKHNSSETIMAYIKELLPIIRDKVKLTKFYDRLIEKEHMRNLSKEMFPLYLQGLVNADRVFNLRFSSEFGKDLLNAHEYQTFYEYIDIINLQDISHDIQFPYINRDMIQSITWNKYNLKRQNLSYQQILNNIECFDFNDIVEYGQGRFTKEQQETLHLMKNML